MTRRVGAQFVPYQSQYECRIRGFVNVKRSAERITESRARNVDGETCIGGRLWARNHRSCSRRPDCEFVPSRLRSQFSKTKTTIYAKSGGIAIRTARRSRRLVARYRGRAVENRRPRDDCDRFEKRPYFGRDVGETKNKHYGALKERLTITAVV